MHPGSCFVVENNQDSLAQFALSKCMMTTPDHLLGIHVERDSLQNEVSHHLSSDWGESDCPVAPWVFLLALFEDWGDICFPPDLRHLSQSP